MELDREESVLGVVTDEVDEVFEFRVLRGMDLSDDPGPPWIYYVEVRERYILGFSPRRLRLFHR